MKLPRITLVSLSIILTVAVVLLVGNLLKKNQELTIGFFGPLTGDLANLGQGARNGVELAMKELSEPTTHIIFEDSACDAKSAMSAVKKLIEVDQVDALVGGLCSSETLAAASLAEHERIPMVSYCSSSPEITNAGAYIYRLYPSDSFQGKFIAEYVYNVFNEPRVAILHVQDGWGEGIYQTFIKSYQGKIIYDGAFTPGTGDFRTELVKIKAQNPEIVFFIGQTSVATPFLKQFRASGIESTVFGGDVWADDAVIKLPEAEGVYYTVPASNWSEEFTNQYREEFGKEPVVCAAQAYDAIKLISDANRKGFSPKEFFDGLKDYHGASGVITLDEKGDLTNAEYEVRKILNAHSSIVK